MSKPPSVNEDFTVSHVVTTQSPSTLPLLGEPGDIPLADAILEKVAAAQKIVITGHERPDGDCLGSEVALCSILRHAGKNAEIINSDPAPRRLQFLLNTPGESIPIRTVVPGERIEADLLFVLDATDLKRLGAVRRDQFPNAAAINIDHHLGNSLFGDINWVDPKSAATGELIWRLAERCGWAVPAAALTALYTALVTDTGQFAYSNTSPRVLRMAAELVERGVDGEAIWQTVYLNKTLPELALEARARASLKCAAHGKLCAIFLTADDFSATQTGPANAEEFSAIPRSLCGVELSLFFYEINGGAQTKVSARSTRTADARALAQKFGGGGHKQAAGFTLDGTIQDVWRKVIDEAVLNVEQGTNTR